MLKIGLKNNLIPMLLSVLMAVLLYSIANATPRSDFNFFIFQYLGLFIIFYIFWLKSQLLDFRVIIILAILLRLVLLDSIPVLSNDFYRFIWDGELMARGINPFANTPNQLMNSVAFYNEAGVDMRMMYHGMGELSQAHYTCYPVLNQILFYLPAKLTDSIFSSIIGLRIIIILADIGAIYFAKRIAEHLNISVHNIWLYALNPFVILEFTGNLHFEGVMIFFLLGGIYALMKNQWILGSVFFACAIHIKLLPLMLIPFALKKLGWRKSVGFVALTGFLVLLIGGTMLNATFYNNMMLSINEYFIRFQFNGSISYLVSEVGKLILGWEPHQFTGPILSIIATCGILTLAIFKAIRNDLDIIKGMLFGLMIYYSLTATVHPWYIGLILVLSIFTQYKFGLIWSFLVMLSYSAYSDPSGFKENSVLIFAEYALVYVVLFYEIFTFWKGSKKQGNLIGIQFKAFFGLK